MAGRDAVRDYAMARDSSGVWAGRNLGGIVPDLWTGIAAGAGEVLAALEDEIAKAKRNDIKVVISACMGMCSSEPNVTVRRLNEEAVLYRDLDADKMREVFQGHIVNGEVKQGYALARIK